MSEKRQKRRGRKVDETGRSIGSAHHVRLYGWLLKTPAWRSLSTQAVAVYIAIAQRYFGSNNGEISLSVREAACLVNIAKDTAQKCFYELETKGFIRRNICGSFQWKRKHATTWILTEHDFQGKDATKDFVRWAPEKSELGPNPKTRCPKQWTKSGRFRSDRHLSVPRLGPWILSCTVRRSQITARI